MVKKEHGRPSQRLPETVYFVEVTGWEWRYWIDRARHDSQLTPVVENRDIVIHGTVRGPKLERVTKAEVHIKPGWKLKELMQPKEGADVLIGSIWMTEGVLEVHQKVTDGAASAILQRLIADKIRFARVTATPLHYRTGMDRGLSL